jgi:hypothetical protein
MPLNPKDPNNRLSSITISGILFQQSGGYTANALKSANEALSVQLEIDRRRTLDALLVANSNRLNVLTNRQFWATVSATLVAIAVLFWYMWSYYHPIK